MEFHETFLENLKFRGNPWNSMELGSMEKVPWNSNELWIWFGQNSMEFYGT